MRRDNVKTPGKSKEDRDKRNRLKFWKKNKKLSNEHGKSVASTTRRPLKNEVLDTPQKKKRSKSKTKYIFHENQTNHPTPEPHDSAASSVYSGASDNEDFLENMSVDHFRNRIEENHSHSHSLTTPITKMTDEERKELCMTRLQTLANKHVSESGKAPITPINQQNDESGSNLSSSQDDGVQKLRVKKAEEKIMEAVLGASHNLGCGPNLSSPPPPPHVDTTKTKGKSQTTGPSPTSVMNLESMKKKSQKLASVMKTSVSNFMNCASQFEDYRLADVKEDLCICHPDDFKGENSEAYQMYMDSKRQENSLGWDDSASSRYSGDDTTISGRILTYNSDTGTASDEDEEDSIVYESPGKLESRLNVLEKPVSLDSPTTTGSDEDLHQVMDRIEIDNAFESSSSQPQQMRSVDVHVRTNDTWEQDVPITKDFEDRMANPTTKDVPFDELSNCDENINRLAAKDDLVSMTEMLGAAQKLKYRMTSSTRTGYIQYAEDLDEIHSREREI